MWLSAIPHRINGAELSQEELQDNLCLIYWLMPWDISATCDCSIKKFFIDHVLLFPNGGLVLARNGDDVKEWGTLGSGYQTPSAISYKPQINSTTV